MLTGAFVVTVQFPLVLALDEGWALQIDRATWPLLYAWPIAVAYVFPNGRLLSPRWRWVHRRRDVSFVGVMRSHCFNPGAVLRRRRRRSEPHGGQRGRGSWADEHLRVAVLWVLGRHARQPRRRRRGDPAPAPALERDRAAAGALARLGGVARPGHAPPLLRLGVPRAGPRRHVLRRGSCFRCCSRVEIAMAVSVGVAVGRYRLYAIERLVNRTLVYVTLTTLLVGAFAGLTIGAGRPRRQRLRMGHGGGDARRRRRVPSPPAARPGSRRPTLQPGALRRGAARAHLRGRGPRRAGGPRRRSARSSRRRSATRSPSCASGFLRRRRSRMRRASSSNLTDDGRARTADRPRRSADGRPAPRSALLARLDLLDGVLAAATLSIEMARLRVELRLQLAEVEASRARIVEAGYEERRRLERDLHDGAQQRLVSLGVQVRRLQRGLPRGAAVLSPALDRVVDEIGGAIGDLRQIAAGVRPARLDDGLSAALADLARSAPIPVDVEVPNERVQASVEAAAYFVACEALTNAVRYASASRVSMRAVRENGTLLVSITDDGIGGAVVRRGSGLAGLQDRVAAHGGNARRLEPSGPRAHAWRWRSRANRDRRRHRAPPRGGRGPARGRRPHGRRPCRRRRGAPVGGRRARAGPRDRRRAHAADVRGRGHARGRRDTAATPGDRRPRALAARRVEPRGRARRFGRRLRLPAEGPGPRRRRVPRSCGAREQRRQRARPGGRQAAPRPTRPETTRSTS